MSSSFCRHSKAISHISGRSLIPKRLRVDFRASCRASRSTLHPRWPSSKRISHSIASTDSISPPFFQPNYDTSESSRDVKGKGREVSFARNKEEVLHERVWEAQSEIEESELWEATSSRYPGMRRQQVTLVAVLQAFLKQKKEMGINLTPLDLLRVHRMLKELDRDGQRQQLWTSRFQKSSVAYTILLKYAHACTDARALKIIASEALMWRNGQGRYNRGSKEIIKNGSVHPRVAAADNLTRLIRNLFVSLAVSQRARISFGRERVMSGTELPTSAPKVTRGDDAITVSTLMRQRVGVYNVATNEDGEPKLLPSRLIKDARYPITHISRRRKRMNRLIEQGKLQQIAKELSKNSGEASIPKVLLDANSRPVSQQIHSRIMEDSTMQTVETTLQPYSTSTSKQNITISGNKDIEHMLSQCRPDSAHGQKMQALLHSYERWQIHLCKRFEAKRTLTSTLWQFNLSPRTATQEDVDAIKQVIPAWLLLSILRLHIETGDKDRAEKVVAAYLQSHQRIYKKKLLVEVIPINRKRVHAITSPITPPNSASLLNGMLRAALTSGAADAFEYMVNMIEKWCYLGGKFSRYVLSEKVQVVERHPAGRSLLPDENTMLLLLESLRHRKKKFSLGVRLIETMWSRWGVVGIGTQRLDFTEPKMHEILVLPNQAFVTMMNWALQDKLLSARQKKVSRVQSMQAEWIDKLVRSNTNTPNLTRDETAAWLNVNKKAQASLV